MKTKIATLRTIAARLRFAVYQQGRNWILSARETEELHHSITTERAALLTGLTRAAERGMLTEAESCAVAAA